MLNVEPFWQYIVVGIIVILAVLIDQARDIIVGRIETGLIYGGDALSSESRERFGCLVAVNRVGLEINAGEVVGLVGDNAAGKSTSSSASLTFLSSRRRRNLLSGPAPLRPSNRCAPGRN